MGSWIKSNKEVFLGGALFLMALSLFSAIQEKRKKGKNTGIIVFVIALIITTFLLFFNRI